jgi:hypothetical protein
MFRVFIKWMAGITGVVWLCLIWPLYVWGEPAIVWAALVGWLLPAFCFVLGFYSIYRYFHLPMQKLMLVFFGGMLARLAVIGGGFFLLLLLTTLHVTSFLASLLGFYILYLILELYFVNGRLQRVKEEQR